jgi:hypothetical protein
MYHKNKLTDAFFHTLKGENTVQSFVMPNIYISESTFCKAATVES